MLPSQIFKRVTCAVKPSSRFVSSKYPRPFPRPYNRRLFEESLKPILPKKIQSCVGPNVIHQRNIDNANEYMDVELALSKLVKKWIADEEYTVVAVCQFLPINGRTLWLAKNQLRSKGLEFRNYGNKVMKKVIEGTPMQSLDPILTGSNAFLFGKDMSCIPTIINETSKLNWIAPLAVVVNNRILSIDTVKELAQYKDIEALRADTVQILSMQLNSIPSTLGAVGNELVGSLTHISQKSE